MVKERHLDLLPRLEAADAAPSSRCRRRPSPSTLSIASPRSMPAFAASAARHLPHLGATLAGANDVFTPVAGTPLDRAIGLPDGAEHLVDRDGEADPDVALFPHPPPTVAMAD